MRLAADLSQIMAFYSERILCRGILDHLDFQDLLEKQE